MRFVTGGAEANELAIQLARRYHVDRGQSRRWQVISPAQAYHGPTMATLALTGRPGLQRPFQPYMPSHLHIPPSTWRFDPTGQQALDALDRALDAAGPETVSAYFCEPISAAALPAYTPPARFWEGLAGRRDRHGFLIVFDEIVTGIGRTGRWFAAGSLPLVPDIIAVAKGLGAGYAAIGAVLCRQHVYAGTARRCPARLASPCSTCSAAKAWSTMCEPGGRGCATSSPTRSRMCRWFGRFAATGSCSVSSTSIPTTASPSCRLSSGQPDGSTPWHSSRAW
ncbi:MAG: aspartate aminotransferase family protein [Chloroflexi bacterium]|nr:MAG: aspartate aminotransferase family protein [Chloroflexota bacterium]